MSSRQPASFLGTGWSFPPSFAASGSAVETVSGVEDVHQALQLLLLTRKGERPMQEAFGAALDGLLFEEMDAALVNRVTSSIHDAVTVFEPRVRVQRIEVTPAAEAGLLHVRLDYQVQGSNSRFNMVFPFYLHEAAVPGA